jgi:hypothetical protein
MIEGFREGEAPIEPRASVAKTWLSGSFAASPSQFPDTLSYVLCE